MTLTADGFRDWSARLGEREEAGRLVDKGGGFFLQGRLAEAQEAYRQAIEKDPRNAVAYGNMGHVLQKRGMYAQAIPWLEKALDMDPQLEGVPVALELCENAACNKVLPISAELVARLKEEGIQFVKKYTETRDTGTGLGAVEYTYEKYSSISVDQAIAFLNTRAVSYNFYYIEVETPKGLVGRDIKGIYREWE